jgi:flavin reductase (DIM6/NTAB) family NADH-FMN oxidoreductase RutF
MRKNFGAKPYLYPMPVLIIATYNEDGTPNAMNAAWGCVSDYQEVAISLSEHKTTENILKRKAFTISMADAAHVTACDYVGMVSAKKVPDKFAKAGFTATKSQFVDAPIINELPMSLECQFVKVNDDGLWIGKIVNVNADERVLDDNGSIGPSAFKPITYDPVNNKYIALGDIVGNAFKDGAKLK